MRVARQCGTLAPFPGCTVSRSVLLTAYVTFEPPGQLRHGFRPTKS